MLAKLAILVGLLAAGVAGADTSATCPMAPKLVCLAGRSGGQTVMGQAGSSGSLNLDSSDQATAGEVAIQDASVIIQPNLSQAGTTIERATLSAGAATFQNFNLGLTNADNVARSVKLYEPSTSGGNFTGLKAQAQAADVTYIFPAAGPTVAGQSLVATVPATNVSTMSWGDPNALTSATADPADTGVIRLASSDAICWENTPSGTDICLGNNTGTDKLMLLGTLKVEKDIELENQGGVAGKVIFDEPNGSGINFTSIAAQAQAADVNYTLPAAAPTANAQFLQATTAGVMSWVQHTSVLFVPAAGCNNATAFSNLDLPTANAPNPVCVTGTNIQKGALQFVDTADKTAQTTMMLPADWISTLGVDLKILFTSPDLTNGETEKWTFATACRTPTGGSGATDDPAFNAADTLTYTLGASEVVSALRVVSKTGITMTGCNASDLLHVKIGRDTTDTCTASNNLIGFELTFRRTS